MPAKKRPARKSPRRAAKPLLAFGVKFRGKLLCYAYPSFTSAKYLVTDCPGMEIVIVKIVEVRR